MGTTLSTATFSFFPFPSVSSHTHAITMSHICSAGSLTGAMGAMQASGLYVLLLPKGHKPFKSSSTTDFGPTASVYILGSNYCFSPVQRAELSLYESWRS